MPDDRLRERMNEWAQRHGIGHDCPACGAQRWQTGEIIAAPVAPSPEHALPERRTRMVQVFCGACGYLLLFDADTVGV
ncbi:MAG: hypothetical protein WBC44_05470 [Planctomycetaceae bacterium]